MFVAVSAACSSSPQSPANPPICHEGWCWENPFPQGNALAAVWADPANNVWAVGKAGTVLTFPPRTATWVRFTIDRSSSGACGLAEFEVAAELEHQARLLGAEGMSFETIVAAGPRSALPHGRATACAAGALLAGNNRRPVVLRPAAEYVR